MQQYYNFYGKLNYDEQVWQKLLEKFGSNNEYYLILKPHPDENIDAYKKILSKYNVENINKLGINFFDLSSSLESQLGYKDHDKIKKFINKINELES